MSTLGRCTLLIVASLSSLSGCGLVGGDNKTPTTATATQGEANSEAGERTCSAEVTQMYNPKTGQKVTALDGCQRSDFIQMGYLVCGRKVSSASNSSSFKNSAAEVDCEQSM